MNRTARASRSALSLLPACLAFALHGCAATVLAPGDGAAEGASDTSPPDAAADTSAPDSTGRSCTPGAQCGNDCYPNDAPCWACGTLYYDQSCVCTASASACPRAVGCDNPAPAARGEFCGTYRWCDRACAAGLRCTGTVPGPNGQPNPGDYRRVCVPDTDAGR